MNHHENKKDGLEQLAQKFSSRYTDWRPNLLHGMSTAVFVGSRTVDSLLPSVESRIVETWKTLGPRVRHTHTTRRSRRKSKAVEKRTFFSKTACTLVVPFLGVQVDQCFCRGGGIVGWKGVCINGVESGS